MGNQGYNLSVALIYVTLWKTSGLKNQFTKYLMESGWSASD